MGEVTVRDLRNDGGHVLDRVSAGEVLTVTRDGRPVAQLRPLPRRPIQAATLVKRWRRLPAIDAVKMRRDIDAVIDASL